MIGRLSDAFVARFMKRLIPHGECLVWTGCIMPSGYGGVFIPGNRKVHTHRVAWEIANGRPPSGVVRHTCDNRPCCNPKHLVDGTQRENILDSISKGRFSFPPVLRGEAHGEAVLSDGQVHEIRRRRTSGEMIQAIADRFGISDSLVSVITRGEAWSHVPLAEGERLFRRGRYHKVTVGGLSMTLIEWARATGLKKSTISKRIKKGWNEQRAVTQLEDGRKMR